MSCQEHSPYQGPRALCSYPDTTTVNYNPRTQCRLLLDRITVDNHVVSSNPATITMNGAHTVQADFALPTPVITWLPLVVEHRE